MTRVGTFFKNAIKSVANFGQHAIKTITPHISYALHQFAGIAPQLGNIGNQLASNYGQQGIGANLQKGIGLAGNIANTIGTGMHYFANKNMAMNNYGKYG